MVVLTPPPPPSPTCPQALLCCHPPDEILSALEEVACEGAMELNRHTSTIDLQQDALQLKWVPAVYVLAPVCEYMISLSPGTSLTRLEG